MEGTKTGFKGAAKREMRPAEVLSISTCVRRERGLKKSGEVFAIRTREIKKGLGGGGIKGPGKKEEGGEGKGRWVTGISPSGKLTI